MIVLHVDSERSWRGGQQQVLLLMRHQRARGHEPHLAAPGDSALHERASAEGLPVHAVPMRGTWDLGSALALAHLSGALRPEVLHWHAARAHALGALASLLDPAPARVLSRRVVFPVRRTPGSRLLYALPVDRIAAISRAVREALIGSGVDPARIDVVPSGIDPPAPPDPALRAGLRKSLGAGEEDVVLLSVSALAPGKGHRDLLRALVRVPGHRLWLAGDGPLRAPLTRECESLGLTPRVQFLGFRTDIFPLLHAADLFALATESEGLGSSILEAMAAGLPVVATRVGGVPEIVEEGKTGVLVPAADPDALGEALARIAPDRVLRERMGGCGRQRAQLFSAGRMAESIEGVYRQALEVRARRHRASSG
jgi:glycosyltransferase involved in cell wall biosynthesis